MFERYAPREKHFFAAAAPGAFSSLRDWRMVSAALPPMRHFSFLFF
jgi:hypothetical protein